MKISMLPHLAAMLLLVSCSGGTNDLDRAGLKGQVKSIREQQYFATFKVDKWVPGKPAVPGYQVTNYDSEGNFTDIYNIGTAGDTMATGSFRHENGELVEETYYYVYNGQTSRTIMERVSDDQVNFEMWSNGQLLFEGASYFDSKGRMIRQAQVLDEREVIMHHIYKKNLLVESYQEELTGERTATRHYDYDGFDREGNWTVRLVYMEEDKITPQYAIKRELTYY